MKKVVGVTFEAMNTTINVQVIITAEWVEKLRNFLNLLPSWFAEIESVLSRFDPRRINGPEQVQTISILEDIDK